MKKSKATVLGFSQVDSDHLLYSGMLRRGEHFVAEVCFTVRIQDGGRKVTVRVGTHAALADAEERALCLKAVLAWERKWLRCLAAALAANA